MGHARSNPIQRRIFLIKYNSCTQRAVSQTSTTIFRSYKTPCCVGVPSTQRHSCWKRLEQKLIMYGSRYVELNIDRVRIQLFSLLLNMHHFEQVLIDSRFPLYTWIVSTANPANQWLKASSSSILHRENEYFFAVTEPPQPTPVCNYWTKSWMDKPCCPHNNVILLLVWLRLILLWHIFKKRLLNTVVMCANILLYLQGAVYQRSCWPLTTAVWCTASAAWRNPALLCHDTSSSTGWVAWDGWEGGGGAGPSGARARSVKYEVLLRAVPF